MKTKVVSATVLSFLTSFWVKPAIGADAMLNTLYADNGLAYVQQGNANSDYRLIFIHGSPGNKEGYQAYLNDAWLADNIDLIAVDRVGYGQSPNQLEVSLDEQSKAISSLLSKDKTNILVGHSLGGPIALNLAIMFPSLVDGMVLVAPAFDPQLEKPKWYNEIADTWLVDLFLSDEWRKSNGEMMPLSEELSKLSRKDWSDLDTLPITLIHGDEDTIADPKNSIFAFERLSGDRKKLVEERGEGHFILWQSPAKVIDQIRKLIRYKP